jgi:hypothetical protein
MRHTFYLKLLGIFLFILFFLFPQPAYAYLDLGSGSYFFQLFIGALLGVLYAIKIYWSKIIIFLKNSFNKRNKSKGV